MTNHSRDVVELLLYEWRITTVAEFIIMHLSVIGVQSVKYFVSLYYKITVIRENLEQCSVFRALIFFYNIVICL